MRSGDNTLNFRRSTNDRLFTSIPGSLSQEIRDECESIEQLRVRALRNTLEDLIEYYSVLEAVAAKLSGSSPFEVVSVWENCLGYSKSVVESTSVWFERANVGYNIAVSFFNQGQVIVAEDAIDVSTRDGRAEARARSRNSENCMSGYQSFLKAAGMFQYITEHDTVNISTKPLELNDDSLEFLENFCVANAVLTQYECSWPKTQELVQLIFIAFEKAKQAALKCPCLMDEILIWIDTLLETHPLDIKRSAIRAMLPSPTIPAEVLRPPPNVFDSVISVVILEAFSQAQRDAARTLDIDVRKPVREMSLHLKERLIAMNLPTGVEVIAQPAEVPLSLKKLSVMLSRDAQAQDFLKSLKREPSEGGFGSEKAKKLLPVRHLLEILMSEQQIAVFLPPVVTQNNSLGFKSQTMPIRQLAHHILDRCWSWDEYVQKLCLPDRSMLNISDRDLGLMEPHTIGDLFTPSVNESVQYARGQLSVGTQLLEKLDHCKIPQLPSNDRSKAAQALMFVGLQFLELMHDEISFGLI